MCSRRRKKDRWNENVYEIEKSIIQIRSVNNIKVYIINCIYLLAYETSRYLNILSL